MKISLDWLGEYVSWSGSAEELAERLTMLGLNVEALARYEQRYAGVVVGRVLDVERHPDADRLSLCTVHDGRQSHGVVCGAPNVRPGLHVLLALPGATLPGGLRIRKTRIRGQESAGMICSARELALGVDAAGIMELPADLAPGTAADEIFGYQDVVLEIEVTPNRPDLLGHLGVAREVAALSGGKLRPPAVWTAQRRRGENLECQVEIESFADCPRYTAHGARDVTVGPAPLYMQNRLRAIGARPINNVVDITNYVLFELGQPLHAFDRAKLIGDRIQVRRAGIPAAFAALDEASYSLAPDHLVIADGEGPVALAGIIGGRRTEVDETTQAVLLESAFFDPLTIRRTARRLGLVTDSSYRFEREADWEMVPLAAQRALHLLQEHAGARPVGDWVDRQDPDRGERPGIPLRTAQVNRVLGTELETAQAATLLQAFCLKVTPLGGGSDRRSQAANLVVTAPSFRRDLHEEIDLIEEIARLHGFERIPAAVRGGGPAGIRRHRERITHRLRESLAAVGYHEIETSSFTIERELAALGLAEGDRRRRSLRLQDARHGAGTLLRTSLLPGLLRVVKHNANADHPLPMRLFQLGRTFLPGLSASRQVRHEAERQLPAEPAWLQLAVAGNAGTESAALPPDMLEIKGMVGYLANLLRIPLRLEPGGEEPFLVPEAQWRIVCGSEPLPAPEEPPPTGLSDGGWHVGWAGAIGDEVRAAHEVEIAVAAAEISLAALTAPPPPIAYDPFSRYPAVKRDLSLLMPPTIRFGDVEAIVRRAGGDLLESLELFDLYRGPDLPEDRTALGIRLKFRSQKGNLKGETVDRAVADIVQQLGRQCDIRLRG